MLKRWTIGGILPSSWTELFRLTQFLPSCKLTRKAPNKTGTNLPKRRSRWSYYLSCLKKEIESKVSPSLSCQDLTSFLGLEVLFLWTASDTERGSWILEADPRMSLDDHINLPRSERLGALSSMFRKLRLFALRALGMIHGTRPMFDFL